MSTKIKICGLTRLEDALVCAEADMLGLNFYRPSPRFIEPAMAQHLVQAARQELGGACPLMVGVFVNADVSTIWAVIDQVGLDYAQLSGDESDEVLAALGGRAVKAIRPRNKGEAVDSVTYYLRHAPHNENMPSLLVDAYHPDLYGGTGERASVDVALAVKERVPRMMLAGGLSPDNVTERVRAIRPWGVDVASGVEDGQPGIKDHERVCAFIQAVREGEST